MRTINLFDSTFTVRSLALDTIKRMQEGSDFTNIQGMLVEFFDGMAGEGVRTDEYALAVAVFFPDSKAWRENRQGRCATDVRKYVKGEFKCMEGYEQRYLKHLDGGTKRATRDPKAALVALAEIEDQLS